ncbi:MAG: hypothetical protein J6Q48_07825 [Bacteroidaceae bacterium]|nr:hypothetical protein [Bacteroidaceae bacterium]
MAKRAGLFERIAASLEKRREEKRAKKEKAKIKKAQKKSRGSASEKRKSHLSDEAYVKRYSKSLSQLIDVANERMIAISEKGLMSKAMYDVSRTGNLEDTMFSIPENITRNDFIELKFKVQTFLNDPTSTIEGAEKFTEENYELYFKRTHSVKKEGDIEATWHPGLFINQDFAKAAYSAYRSAVEDAQIASFSQYDSESLILYTFSYMDQHGITSIESDDDRGAVVEALRQYAEQHDKERRDQIKALTEGKNPENLGDSSLFRKR